MTEIVLPANSDVSKEKIEFASYRFVYGTWLWNDVFINTQVRINEMFEIQYSSQECLSTAVVFAKECWVNNLQGSKYTTVLREHSSASDSCPSAVIQPFSWTVSPSRREWQI